MAHVTQKGMVRWRAPSPNGWKPEEYARSLEGRSEITIPEGVLWLVCDTATRYGNEIMRAECTLACAVQTEGVSDEEVTHARDSLHRVLHAVVWPVVVVGAQHSGHLTFEHPSRASDIEPLAESLIAMGMADRAPDVNGAIRGKTELLAQAAYHAELLYRPAKLGGGVVPRLCQAPDLEIWGVSA